MDIVFCFSVDFETATIGDPTVDLTGERARLGLFLNENMVPCGDGEGIESTDPKLCKEFPSLDLSRALQKRWIMGVELRCTRPPGKRHGATGYTFLPPANTPEAYHCGPEPLKECSRGGGGLVRGGTGRYHHKGLWFWRGTSPLLPLEDFGLECSF